MSDETFGECGTALNIPLPPLFSNENNGFNFIDFSNNCCFQNEETNKLKGLVQNNSILLTKLQEVWLNII